MHLYSYKTPEGYNLGTWQHTQKQSYKKSKLAPDRIKRLEKIGFRWSPHDEKFEQGFQETLRYKEQSGDSNALSSYKTPDGYNLGMWQSTQRNSCNKGKLSTDRIKRLEEIGFKWALLEESLSKVFRKPCGIKSSLVIPMHCGGIKHLMGITLGCGNAPKRYSYKKGKLSTDRIKKLEEIGFKWQFRKLNKPKKD